MKKLKDEFPSDSKRHLDGHTPDPCSLKTIMPKPDIIRHNIGDKVWQKPLKKYEEL